MARFDLVIFDLDGTLTVPYLDFRKIRGLLQDALQERFKISMEEPLLERLLELEGEARRVAFEILEFHEDDAAAHSTLNPGASDVLSELRKRKMATALLSRNRRRSVDTVLAKHGLAFDWVATRDDGPVKPDPRSVLRIVEHFRASPARTLVIGDYKYDIEAGRAAGTRTCLLTNGKRPSFEIAADHVIERLLELLPLV